MIRFIFAVLLALPLAAVADTVTFTWDAYKDSTVATYNAADYEIQIMCGVNGATLANVTKVGASVSSRSATIALNAGDKLSCIAKAHRLSDNAWGLASVAAVYVKPAGPPSAPGGLILRVVP